MANSSAGAGIFFLLAMLGLYFIPGIVASTRGHKNALGVWLLNLLLGWTLLGWVVALVWAVASANPSPIIVHTTSTPGEPSSADATPAAELEKFAQLRDKGILTDEEFAAKKRQLLGLPAQGAGAADDYLG